MKKKTEQLATFIMKQIIEEKDIVDSSKRNYILYPSFRKRPEPRQSFLWFRWQKKS